MKMKRWFRTVMVDRGRHILGRSGVRGKRLLVLVLVPALLLAALGVQPHVAEAQSCSVVPVVVPDLNLNGYYYNCGPWSNSIGQPYYCLYTYTQPAVFVGCYQTPGAGEYTWHTNEMAGHQCHSMNFNPLSHNRWVYTGPTWCMWRL